MTKAQYKGYLLEKICRLLLEDAGYTLMKEDDFVKYKGSDKFVELIGRGTKHQIDLPYEFNYHVPFVNQIQIIGEVKYYSSAIAKSYIRSFIGVIKDISENYVISHVTKVDDLKERKLVQALFISASGFQIEAEKLALAHNIKLITFHGNPVFQPILRHIEDLTNNYDYLGFDYHSINYRNHIIDPEKTIKELFNENVKSYFLATTRTGYLMYFVSNQEFIFSDEDVNLNAMITYSYDENNKIDKFIKLIIENKVFISTLPLKIYNEFKKEHEERGNAINSKYSHFSPLTVYKKNNLGILKIYQIQFNLETS